MDESDFVVEEAKMSGNKLVIPNIVFDNDIETEISNQDPNLNEKKITVQTEELSFDAEIVEEHPDEKENKPGMVLINLLMTLAKKTKHQTSFSQGEFNKLISST